MNFAEQERLFVVNFAEQERLFVVNIAEQERLSVVNFAEQERLFAVNFAEQERLFVVNFAEQERLLVVNFAEQEGCSSCTPFSARHTHGKVHREIGWLFSVVANFPGGNQNEFYTVNTLSRSCAVGLYKKTDDFVSSVKTVVCVLRDIFFPPLISLFPPPHTHTPRDKGRWAKRACVWHRSKNYDF